MDVNIPNFFIIGAPRSGTTSLSEYIRQSPDVFFSKYKEPKFFDTDLKHPKRPPTVRVYVDLHFRGAEKYKAVGEGTVWYLYSREAVKNILARNPKAKFIVLLRNPTDMVYSLHQHLLLYGNEDIEDFAVAWNIQEARLQGEHLPPRCSEVKKLMYKDIGRYGEQLERVLAQAPSKNILVLRFDDLVRNPVDVCKRVSDFLEVTPPAIKTYERFNSCRKHRSFFVRNYIRQLYRHASKYNNNFFKQAAHTIDRWNQEPYTRPPLNPLMREKLVAHFLPDISLLENLTGFDLTAWKR